MCHTGLSDSICVTSDETRAGQRRPNTAHDLGWESELPPSILVAALQWFRVCSLMVRKLREYSCSVLGGLEGRMDFGSF